MKTKHGQTFIFNILYSPIYTHTRSILFALSLSVCMFPSLSFLPCLSVYLSLCLSLYIHLSPSTSLCTHISLISPPLFPHLFLYSIHIFLTPSLNLCLSFSLFIPLSHPLSLSLSNSTPSLYISLVYPYLSNSVPHLSPHLPLYMPPSLSY